jgi:hypothetical protein
VSTSGDRGRVAFNSALYSLTYKHLSAAYYLSDGSVVILTVAQYYTPMHRTIQVLHTLLVFELKAGARVWAEPGGSDLLGVTALLMFYLAVLSLDTDALKFAHAGVEFGKVFWYPEF